MTAAKTVSAEITRYNNAGESTKITAGGTVYTAAKIQNAKTPADDITNEQIDGEKHTLVLDEYGYLIGLAEDTVAANTYVYLAWAGASTSSVDGFDAEVTKAVVYYADGTKDTIVVTNDFSGFSVGEDAGLYLLEKASNGDITLTAGEAITDATGSAQLKKGIATVDTDVKANKDTVFFFVSGENSEADTLAKATKNLKVEVVTGINNVTTISGTQAVESYAAVDEENLTAAVYVSGKAAGEKGTTVYYYDGNSFVQDLKDVTYTVYDAAGTKVELTYTYETVAKAKEAAAAATAGFVTKGAESLAEYDDTTPTVVEAGEVTAVTGDTITVDGNDYYVSADTVIVITVKDVTVAKTADLEGQTVTFTIAKEGATEVVTLIVVPAEES
jgi:hypothetical protein